MIKVASKHTVNSDCEQLNPAHKSFQGRKTKNNPTSTTINYSPTESSESVRSRIPSEIALPTPKLDFKTEFLIVFVNFTALLLVTPPPAAKLICASCAAMASRSRSVRFCVLWIRSCSSLEACKRVSRENSPGFLNR